MICTLQTLFLNGSKLTPLPGCHARVYLVTPVDGVGAGAGLAGAGAGAGLAGVGAGAGLAGVGAGAGFVAETVSVALFPFPQFVTTELDPMYTVTTWLALHAVPVSISSQEKNIFLKFEESIVKLHLSFLL